MSQPRPLFWLRAGQTVSNSFVLSAKQSSRTSNFNVFCLTWPGIEPCQANAQPLHCPAAVKSVWACSPQEKAWRGRFVYNSQLMHGKPLKLLVCSIFRMSLLKELWSKIIWHHGYDETLCLQTAADVFQADDVRKHLKECASKIRAPEETWMDEIWVCHKYVRQMVKTMTMHPLVGKVLWCPHLKAIHWWEMMELYNALLKALPLKLIDWLIISKFYGT